MNTKLMLSVSAFILALIGIVLIFAPEYVLKAALIPETLLSSLIIQVLGGTYFALALLNWMSKGAIIGGIYNRPMVLANLAHYLIGGLAFAKAALQHPAQPLFIAVFAFLYIFMAGVFLYLMNKHPEKQSN